MDRVNSEVLLAVTPYGVLDCILSSDGEEYQIRHRQLTETSAQSNGWINPDASTLRNFFPGSLGDRLMSSLLAVQPYSTETSMVGALNADGEQGVFRLNLEPLNGGGVFLDLSECPVEQYGTDWLGGHEPLMQQLIDTDPNCIFIKDSMGCYVLANRAMAGIYQTTPENMLGKTDLDLLGTGAMTEKEAQEFIAADTKVLRTREQEVIMEGSMTTTDGRKRWFRTVKAPLSSAGHPDHLLGVAVEITGEVEARQDLEERLQFQEILLDTVPIPIYYLNNDNIYQGCNRAFAEMMDIEKDELIGRSVDQVWPVEQAAEYMRQNRELLARQGRHAESRRERMPDGRVLDLIIVKEAFADRQGRPAGIIGAAVDLTDQKRLQAALQESESRYRRYFEGSLLGIFISDLDGTLREVNSSLAAMMGWESPEEALKEASHLRDWVQAPEKNEIIRIEEQLEAGRPVIVEAEYRHRDGSSFLGRSHLQKVPDPVRGSDFLEGMIENVTEQRAAEEALVASEERFRTLYESVQVGVLVQRPGGQITHANHLAAEILGLPAEEITRRTDKDPDWQMVMEDGTPVAGNEHPSMITLNTGQPCRNVIRGMYGGKGERARWIMINTTPVFEQDGTGVEEVIATFSDITELKRTRDELMESERRLSTLMGNLPGMAYRCRNDPDWTMEFVSQGCFPLTGFPAGDLIQNRKKSYADLIHPDDRNLVYEAVSSGVSNNRQFQMEYRIHTRDGEERWVWEQGCLVEGQNEPMLEGFIIDISERREAQEALEEREATLNRVMQTSPVGIGVAQGGRVAWVNDYFCGIFGVERQDVLGRHNSDIFESPAEFLRLREAVKEKSGQRAVAVEEIRLRRRTGEIIDCLVHVSLSDPQNAHGQVTFAVQDISERKRVQEALRDREAHYRTVYEQSPVGISIVDLDMRFVELNPAFETLLGYSSAEVRGMHLRDLTHPDDIDSNLEMQGKLASGELTNFGMEKRLVHKDGHFVATILAASLIRDAQGKPLHFLGQVLDISRRKRAEEEVRRINDELEERVRRRTTELEKVNADLRRFAKLAAGREIRMAELKQEIKELRAKLETPSGRGGDSQ